MGCGRNQERKKIFPGTNWEWKHKKTFLTAPRATRRGWGWQRLKWVCWLIFFWVCTCALNTVLADTLDSPPWWMCSVPGTSLGAVCLCLPPLLGDHVANCSWHLVNQQGASLLGCCGKTWLWVSFDIQTFRNWFPTHLGSGFGRGHLGIVSYLGVGNAGEA